MSTAVEVGHIEALYRYPVKSMRGERLEAADLGWHGLDGDRRLAFRRLEDRGGFPWLTATRLPELLLYVPEPRPAAAGDDLPTHIRTPEGEALTVFGEELAADVTRRHGSPVQMMYLNRGIFDEAGISVISSATVAEVGRLAAQPADVRRFRPNIVISPLQSIPFAEDEWVGGTLSFGDAGEVAVAVTNRDERCSMVNYDPDSARSAAEMLKVIVRARDNRAGVYGTAMRRGRLVVGQPVFFVPPG
jgi:hypothetical protein